MDDTIFKFELVDNKLPDDVIRDKLAVVKEATKEYVIGHVNSYSGHIRSYTKQTNRWSLISDSVQPEYKEVDIQSELGVQDKEVRRFEVFLSVKGLTEYKYRMMFIEYTSITYPVTVVLNENLAHIYTNSYKETFRIESVNALEIMIDKILNSQYFTKLLQSLINEALRKENRGEETEDE